MHAKCLNVLTLLSVVSSAELAFLSETTRNPHEVSESKTTKLMTTSWNKNFKTPTSSSTENTFDDTSTLNFFTVHNDYSNSKEGITKNDSSKGKRTKKIFKEENPDTKTGLSLQNITPPFNDNITTKRPQTVNENDAIFNWKPEQSHKDEDNSDNPLKNELFIEGIPDTVTSQATTVTNPTKKEKTDVPEIETTQTEGKLSTLDVSIKARNQTNRNSSEKSETNFAEFSSSRSDNSDEKMKFEIMYSTTQSTINGDTPNVFSPASTNDVSTWDSTKGYSPQDISTSTQYNKNEFSESINEKTTMNILSSFTSEITSEAPNQLISNNQDYSSFSTEKLLKNLNEIKNRTSKSTVSTSFTTERTTMPINEMTEEDYQSSIPTENGIKHMYTNESPLKTNNYTSEIMSTTSSSSDGITESTQYENGKSSTSEQFTTASSSSSEIIPEITNNKYKTITSTSVENFAGINEEITSELTQPINEFVEEVTTVQSEIIEEGYSSFISTENEFTNKVHSKESPPMTTSFMNEITSNTIYDTPESTSSSFVDIITSTHNELNTSLNEETTDVLSILTSEITPEINRSFTTISNQNDSSFSIEKMPENSIEMTQKTTSESATSTFLTTERTALPINEMTEIDSTIYPEISQEYSISTPFIFAENGIIHNFHSNELPTSTNILKAEYSTGTIIYTTPQNNASSCEDTARIVDYVIGTEKTYIEIDWTLEPKEINSSCQLKINVSCISTDNFDWIVHHQSNSTDVMDATPVSSLENLSEFTNYSCLGQLFIDNEDQTILSTKSFKITTEKEVPSSINVEIIDITAHGFTLEWKRPHKIPGNLQMYYIQLKKKSKHYIREMCSTKNNTIIIPFSSETENVHYNFTKAEPNHQYEVQILAEDEAGKSKGQTLNIVTASSPSTQPLKVTSTLQNLRNHCNGKSYNTTLLLHWQLPCNTNGELVDFKIEISEMVYSGNKSKYTENSVTYRVPKHSDIKIFDYQLIVENLNASCAYEINVQAVTGHDLQGARAYHRSKRTVEGCPSEPSKATINFNETSFFLEWKQPEKFYGKILDYNILLSGPNPKHALSKDLLCPPVLEKSLEKTTNTTYLELENSLPNSIYLYKIRARTKTGMGNASVGEILTPPRVSDPIRNLEVTKSSEIISYHKYEYKVRINFQEPCNTNDIFLYYMIEERGIKQGYQEVYTKINVTKTHYESVLRKPDYNYEFIISVVTDKFVSKTVTKNVSTSAGVPLVNENKIQCLVEKDNPTTIEITLEKDVFSDYNGVIIHYAIFLLEGILENPISPELSFGIYNKVYPAVNKTTYSFIKTSEIRQITSDQWVPFSDGNTKTTVSIGKKEHCAENNYCLQLSENTNYIVILRGFTKNTYRDVFVEIKTGEHTSNVGTFFISFIVLVIITLIGIYLYSKRSQYLDKFRSIPNTTIEEITLRHVVAVKHFIAYYNKIQNDPTLLRKQYEEIEDEIKKYKEEKVHSTFALKPENKRKNRYTNILPYDEFRVKLNMDEDDEISSDYINASYIKGVSGEIEYIATQGPLEHTCKDFWKMVIQENITVIVMVSQFIEKEKEKCYKYFPKNHENMMICEDLEVKCLTELQFDTYCVRTLLIKKDIKQYSVVHMQYLDWPDFGCPTGTYNMLSFCEEVRDRIQIEKGLMAVHCSAGVGRTGTLISLDILLQAMRKEKEISVFECVMDLRKQRTHMVQTEKQYVYIHTCLKDVLENCSLYSFDDTKKNDEHTYQNILSVKVRGGRNSKIKEKESAF